MADEEEEVSVGSEEASPASVQQEGASRAPDDCDDGDEEGEEDSTPEEEEDEEEEKKDGQQEGQAAAPRSLKFSIENILRPDFGAAAAAAAAAAPPHTPPTTHQQQPPSPATATQHHNNNNNNNHHHHHHHHHSNHHHHHHHPVDLSKASPEATNPTLPQPLLWPAWVYCTRYSDRPSSGPRSRRTRKRERRPEEKRPRTAFTQEQLQRLKREFEENRYLTEKRRQALARELALNESQIKIWFQNKRAKIKKASGQRNPLALQLMAQGLYNHSTIPVRGEDDDGGASGDGANLDMDATKDA